MWRIKEVRQWSFCGIEDGATTGMAWQGPTTLEAEAEVLAIRLRQAQSGMLRPRHARGQCQGVDYFVKANQFDHLGVVSPTIRPIYEC